MQFVLLVDTNLKPLQITAFCPRSDCDPAAEASGGQAGAAEDDRGAEEAGEQQLEV